jgi:Fur family ferric uptake transcriptional regulator
MIERQLEEDDTFGTAQTIYERLRAKGRHLGTATVYRNLRSMAADGDVDSLREGGETYYRLCRNQHHHHHMVCRRCGKAVEIEIPGLERWISQESMALGFADPSHAVEIFGVCPECQMKSVKEQRSDEHHSVR